MMQVFSKIHSPCLGEIEFIVALLGLENELIEAVAAHYNINMHVLTYHSFQKYLSPWVSNQLYGDK